MKEFSAARSSRGASPFEGESEDEILEQVAAHARDEHGMHEVPPEVVDKVVASISER